MAIDPFLDDDERRKLLVEMAQFVMDSNPDHLELDELVEEFEEIIAGRTT
jgi:hypothetical protein